MYVRHVAREITTSDSLGESSFARFNEDAPVRDNDIHLFPLGCRALGRPHVFADSRR